MDALVAEKVMGYPALMKQMLDKLGDHIPGEIGYGFQCLVCGRYPIANGKCLPNYSTDITDAWRVVEKLKTIPNDGSYGGDEGPHPIEIKFDGEIWEVKWGLRYWVNEFYTYAHTAPEAICLAALKATEVPSPSVADAPSPDST